MIHLREQVAIPSTTVWGQVYISAVTVSLLAHEAGNVVDNVNFLSTLEATAYE